MQRVWVAVGLAVVALVAFGAVLAAVPFAAGAAAPPKAGVRPARAIVDSTLGLSRTSVFSVPVPPPVRPESGAPGDRPRRARAYPGAPPQAPHGIADFLPITRAENQCLECHGKAGAQESGAVPIPDSHYTDLRNAPGKVATKLAGARYLCITCHAAGSDAKPLVENRHPK